MEQKNEIRISQCMIVKNEEKNIKRALSWGKEIMSEQIVVDTGSTDRTVEIAKEMGAQVYYFEWINDFAAAKNYAIEKATGQWIAFLDADEYMTKEDAETIKEHILEYMAEDMGENQPNAITCKLVDLDGENKVFNIASQNRFFKNNGIRYKGKVHEAISKAGGLYIKELDDVKIFHTGYQKDAIISQKKGKRNVELIENELKENPDSFLMKSYLVDSLLLYITEAKNSGDTNLAKELKDKTDKLALECMENLNKDWDYQRKTALAKVYFVNVLSGEDKDIEEKMAWGYEECQKVMPENGDIEYFIGTRYYNMKNYDNTVVYFERALRKLKKAGIDDVYNNGHLKTSLDTVYFILAIIYLNENILSQALKYLVLAIQMDKFNVEKVMILIQVVKEMNGAQLESELDGIFQKIYDDTKTKDKVFVYSLAKKLGMVTIEKNIEKKFTKIDREIAGI